MKLQQLNEVKYAGKKDLAYLLHNFFDDGHKGEIPGTEYYFKKGFQGFDDGQSVPVGIGVGEYEETLYFIDKYEGVEDLQREEATLDQILRMVIYNVRKVHP